MQWEIPYNYANGSKEDTVACGFCLTPSEIGCPAESYNSNMT